MSHQEYLDKLLTKEKVYEWLRDVCDWRCRWNELSIVNCLLYNYLFDVYLTEDVDTLQVYVGLLVLNDETYDIPTYFSDMVNYFLSEIDGFDCYVTRNEYMLYMEEN